MRQKLTFLLILVFLFFIGCETPSQPKIPELWVWVHADTQKSDADWARDFEKLSNAGFTGILMGANVEVLSRAIPQAKKQRLAVHAWLWAMNRGDADTAWLSVNQLGESLAEQQAYVGYYKFMCPALPEVRDFIKTKIDALAAIPGLDGIHLDYIRYVDAILPVGLQPKYNLNQDRIFPEFDYGYHPYMVKLFKDKTGRDPCSLPDPANDPEWLQFRLDELNKTVWALRDHIRNYGLEATAAVFPTPAMARQMVRQQWDVWDLDAYFPMVYHNFYNQDEVWIEEVMRENTAAIPAGQKVICGLYLPALKKEGALDSAIAAALKGGADGLALFDFAAMDSTMLEVLGERE